MRIIAEIKSDLGLDPLAFSSLLTSHGIRHELQESFQEDGKRVVRVWVYDEDEIDLAQKLYQEFSLHPKKYTRAEPLPSPSPMGESPKGVDAVIAKRAKNPLFPTVGTISIAILALVIFIFVWGQIHREMRIPPKIPGVADAPIVSGLEEELLYDYPYYFTLRDQLLKKYPPSEIKEGLAPSGDAKAVLAEMKQTSYWNGIYDRFINHVTQDTPLKYEGPIFEKIGQGEVWRLFTPAFLHYDFLHIFFNVLWFIILTNQIEFRIGSARYLFFFLAASLISNTAQYLMSGSFFMGLSGVICAMAAFIWARQTVAPWEGYILNRLTLIFLLVFVLGIFGLQLVFFFLELFSTLKLQIPIANTAHIVGGLVGYALGRLKFFSLRTRRH